MSIRFKTVPGGVTAPSGFRAAGVACGIKKDGAYDLALIASDLPAAAAGLFTRNRVVAAPVLWTRKILRQPNLRAVIVNSGCANACTGEQGNRDVETLAAQTAKSLSIGKEEVAVSSTGVIGQPLPMARILTAIPKLAGKLSARGGGQAARAILTTDTRPKTHAVEFSDQEGKVRIGGIAKGSGMIHPNMATMLVFLTTDAVIVPETLKHALQEAVDSSFHRITVDGDTSTNDTVLLLANGASGARIHKEDLVSSGFQDGLNRVCLNLARKIVEDGEGASKFVTIRVVNGRNEEDCLKVAGKIAGSNLVKTAIFGEDANWGRILSAAGTAGVPLCPEKIAIYFDRVQLVRGGVSCGPAQEKKAARVLRKKKIRITVDLNLGTASAEVYTCDLSYDYVRINAEYRS